VRDRLRRIRSLVLAIAGGLAWLPPLAARVAVGLVFVTAGWGKLHNLTHVVEFFRSLGIPAPELQAPFVASVELAGGLLLVLGLGTRFVAVPLACTMIVAIATALWPDLEGAIDLLGKSELVYIVIFAWLAIAGAGAVSLDALVARALGRGSERP
jgi:putative oxidoreductase